MSLFIFFMVVVLTGMLLTGDYLIKSATIVRSPVVMLVLAALIWSASIPGWYLVNKTSRIAILGAMFAVISVIGTTMIGVVIFREKLSVLEWVGIGLAIVSMMLLSRKM